VFIQPGSRERGKLFYTGHASLEVVGETSSFWRGRGCQDTPGQDGQSLETSTIATILADLGMILASPSRLIVEAPSGLTVTELSRSHTKKEPYRTYRQVRKRGRRTKGHLSLQGSYLCGLPARLICVNSGWRKIFVYPTSDPDRNTFCDMSELMLCRSYITHDSSKHFESIIILNHAYG